MAKERKASVIYEGNGTQQTFSFPFDYLRKAFVKAEIIESSGITELEQGKDYSITDKELTLASGVSVATGKLLKIYRETTTDPLVEWQDASVLRSADLSLQEVQLLHLAEETADKVFDSGMSTAPTNTNVWDGQYKRITNLLDPQEDGDAMTLRYANNKQHGLITALKNEGATQDAGLKATGDSQNTRLTTTGNTQNTRLTTTGDTQNKRLTDTGDSYVATMTTLKDTATTAAKSAQDAANGMPTGTVLAFAGNTVPNNYLLCNGSAVSRSTYANLFKVIGTTYGAGDGSTTFNLPNLVDKFVEGSATAGTVKSAGLPNITGSFKAADNMARNGLYAGVVDPQGAFATQDSYHGVVSVKDGNYSVIQGSLPDIVKLDASKSNSIYGKSTTVQPPAVTMRYIIKY